MFLKNQDLISVGIPTYNRAEQLKKALDSLIAQDYENLDIIISDNCSLSSETDKVVDEFMSRDKRIRYFKQDTNKGAEFNFLFVRNQVLGKYLIYLADDHLLPDKQMISKLYSKLDEDKKLLLAFPNTDLIFPSGEIKSQNCLSNIYSQCTNEFSYIKSLCKYGGGYPFYGLYNLENMKSLGLEFTFESDLRYYTEGIFLYKIFLAGGARFVENTTYQFSIRILETNPDILFALKTFLNYILKVIDRLKYVRRILETVYKSSKLTKAQKKELFLIIVGNNAVAFFRRVTFPFRVVAYWYSGIRKKSSLQNEL